MNCSHTARLRQGTERRSQGEDGFTLVEALTSVAVYSIIAAVLFMGVALGLRAIIRVSRTAKENAELLLLDEVLRSTASNVLIPFWEKKIGVTTVSGDPGGAENEPGGRSVTEAVVPWYLGMKTAVARFKWSGKKLTVATPDREIVLPAEWESFRIYIFEDGISSGLAAEVTLEGSETVSILAPFGAIPLSPDRDD